MFFARVGLARPGAFFHCASFAARSSGSGVHAASVSHASNRSESGLGSSPNSRRLWKLIPLHIDQRRQCPAEFQVRGRI